MSYYWPTTPHWVIGKKKGVLLLANYAPLGDWQEEKMSYYWPTTPHWVIGKKKGVLLLANYAPLGDWQVL